MSAEDKDPCPEDRAAVWMAQRTPDDDANAPGTGGTPIDRVLKCVVRCSCRLPLLWSDKKTARH